MKQTKEKVTKRKYNLYMNNKENIKLEVFNKYLEIKQDILRNLKEVSLRSNYYTKKYRGNRITDINVGISENELQENRVQIFIRHQGIWIKDVLIYNSKGLKNSTINTNIHD